MALTSDLVLRIIVFGAYLLYNLRYEIPNLMCGCILGWRCDSYHFQVTVTLTSELVMELPLSGCILGWWSAVYFFVTLTLTSDLVLV